MIREFTIRNPFIFGCAFWEKILLICEYLMKILKFWDNFSSSSLIVWTDWTKGYLDRELYMHMSRSLRGNDQNMILLWTGSGILSYCSSTLWNGSFSATILAEMSSKESQLCVLLDSSWMLSLLFLFTISSLLFIVIILVHGFFA